MKLSSKLQYVLTISSHDIQIGMGCLDELDHINLEYRIALGRVDNDGIEACFDQQR